MAALARKAGLRGELDPVPSLALGAVEVTPLELAAAYAPFANGGYRVEPSLVRRIELADGTVLWRAPEPKPDAGAGRGGGVPDHLDAALGGGRGNRAPGARAGRAAAPSPARPAPPTTARTSGSWGTRRPSSPRSGSATTCPARSRQRLRRPPRRAGVGGLLPQRLEGDGRRPTAWEPPVGLVSRTIDAYTGDLANEWCPTHPARVVQARDASRSGSAPDHDAPLIAAAGASSAARWGRR